MNDREAANYSEDYLSPADFVRINFMFDSTLRDFKRKEKSKFFPMSNTELLATDSIIYELKDQINNPNMDYSKTTKLTKELNKRNRYRLVDKLKI